MLGQQNVPSQPCSVEHLDRWAVASRCRPVLLPENQDTDGVSNELLSAIAVEHSIQARPSRPHLGGAEIVHVLGLEFLRPGRNISNQLLTETCRSHRELFQVCADHEPDHDGSGSSLLRKGLPEHWRRVDRPLWLPELPWSIGCFSHKLQVSNVPHLVWGPERCGTYHSNLLAHDFGKHHQDLTAMWGGVQNTRPSSHQTRQQTVPLRDAVACLLKPCELLEIGYPHRSWRETAISL